MKSKIEYIKGFAKAIRLNEANDNTSRLINAIIECLDEMAERIDEQAEYLEELDDVVDDIQDTLDDYDDIFSDLGDDDDIDDCIFDFGEDEDIWTDDDDDDIDDDEADDEDDEDDEDEDDEEYDVSEADIADAFGLFDKILNGVNRAESRSEGEPKAARTQTISSEDAAKAKEALRVMESIFNSCNPSDKAD